MTDLGRSARELLDTAKRADSAPAGHLPYGRGRLTATLAAGAVTTSAFAAKGALLGASPAVGTTTASLVSTLVSAVAIGVSTGLIALSPASNTPRPPRTEQNTGAGNASANLVPRAQVGSNRPSVLPASSQPRPPLEAQPAVVAPTPASPTAAAPTEAQPAVVAPAQPTRASIAHETALLAEAQRALKAGRAMMALDALDRYAEQCPQGLLQEEATVARVLALCALGRGQDARRWADEFQRQYPTSPLLPRIQNACSSKNPQSADEASSND